MVLKSKFINRKRILNRYDPGKDGYQISDGIIVTANSPIWNFPVTPTVMDIKNTPIPNTLIEQPPANNVKNKKLVWGKNLEKYSNLAPQAISFGSDLTNAFNPTMSSEDIVNESGTSEGTINGISYQKYNGIDSAGITNRLKSENTQNTLNLALKGAKLGNSFGPIGAAAGGIIGAIGGLIGGAHRKRKLDRMLSEARNKINRTNSFNQSSAQSEALSRDYYNDNGNTQNQILYANKGKDMVWTPTGYRSGNVNSLVGKGESIINYENQTGTLVSKGERGIDNQPSSVHKNDNNVIIGNDVDVTTGYKFSDQAAPYTKTLEYVNKQESKAGRYENLSSLSKQTSLFQKSQTQKLKESVMQNLKDISDRQKLQHDLENNIYKQYNYDTGKDRTFNWKDAANIASRQLPAVFGMLASLNQYNTYNREPVKYHNTYKSNPYAKQALNGLASQRYDIYPQLKEIRDAERRGDYAINNSGGMSGSQRYMARVANALGTQRNIANAFREAQDINSKYKQQYYSTLLGAGENERQARTQAAQHDWADYVASHGAKYKGRDTAVANMLNQLNQGFANEFKYNTWKDTLRLYDKELTQNQKEYLNNLNNSRGYSTNQNFDNIAYKYGPRYNYPTYTFNSNPTFQDLLKTRRNWL